MKKFALLAVALGLSSAAFGADRRPSRDEFHPHRACIAEDAEGIQYIGYDDNAAEDARSKCVFNSESPRSCRVMSCFDDFGFRSDFSDVK